MFKICKRQRLHHTYTQPEFLSQATADRRPRRDPVQQLIKACSAEFRHALSLSRLYPKNSSTLAFHIFNSLCLFHHLHFLSVADAFVPSINLNFSGVNFIHAHTRRHTQLRHQSLLWPTFETAPYLKLKLFPPQNAAAAHLCCDAATLFEMDSPHWAYRRSVLSVMALRVD